MKTLNDIVIEAFTEDSIVPCGDGSCLICQVGRAYKESIDQTAINVCKIELSCLTKFGGDKVLGIHEVFFTGILIGVEIAEAFRKEQNEQSKIASES